MNISIIVPNYNGDKILIKNLPKVIEASKNYKKGIIEIIIPDDASSDNSREIIEKFIKEIKEKNIIGKTIENRNKKETGFAKNVTRGVRLAAGEIVILLNTDVAPHEDFLDPLIKHFANEDVFAVACMDESIEDGKIILRGRGIGSWQRGFLIHKAGSVDKNNTLWVSGGSGAFRKSIWDKLGGLDLLYNPFYWEDIDLSYRALKSGYKIFFEPKSIVIHKHSEGIIKSKFKTNYIRKIAYRNQFIFVWKNITDLQLLVSHFLWLPYHFLKAIQSRDWPFFSGFISALLQIVQVRKSRKIARKLFIRKDNAVIKEYCE